jgi:hypothetical protein
VSQPGLGSQMKTKCENCEKTAELYRPFFFSGMTYGQMITTRPHGLPKKLPAALFRAMPNLKMLLEQLPSSTRTKWTHEIIFRCEHANKYYSALGAPDRPSSANNEKNGA